MGFNSENKNLMPKLWPFLYSLVSYFTKLLTSLFNFCKRGDGGGGNDVLVGSEQFLADVRNKWYLKISLTLYVDLFTDTGFWCEYWSAIHASFFVQLNNTFVNFTLLHNLGLHVDNEPWL